MKGSSSQFCTTPTLRIEYADYGDRQAAPIILLHGFPDAPVAWKPVIDGLRKKRLRILVPYLRGYGGSEVLHSDLIGGQEAALGSDLLEFADALGLETFHLAGHDWGARTAYAACVFAPDRIKSLLTLATPYVLYGGREHPPNEVRAHWYQWFFQLEHGTQNDGKQCRNFLRGIVALMVTGLEVFQKRFCRRVEGVEESAVCVNGLALLPHALGWRAFFARV